ncbi:MAG: hypothetical protein Q8R47_00300 [Nanoarchaeota archaeon]|nr:hypothetical protein [Nanoarchaeota archaeon]
MITGIILGMGYYSLEMMFDYENIQNFIFNSISLGAMIFAISVTTLFYFTIKRMEGEFGTEQIKWIIPTILGILSIWATYLKIFI